MDIILEKELSERNHEKQMNKKSNSSIKTSIGGQALMEGIMMRGPKRSAMAVRNPKGEIVLEEWDTKNAARNRFCRWPIVRGVFGFIDAMTIGYKCLMRSAEISGLEEIEEEERRAKAAKKAAKEKRKAEKRGEAPASSSDPIAGETEGTKPAEGEEKRSDDANSSTGNDKKKKSATMTFVMVASIVLAVVLVVGLFIWFPSFLYAQLGRVIPFMRQDNRYLKSVFEGILKVLLLVIYMFAVSRTKDIRSTFMYHGAEHKTIFCYEYGLPLTVENVRMQKRFHPRCGTSFLVLMVLVSILIGFLIPPQITLWLRTLIRIALIPLIMGIGYELIKLAGRHDNLLTRIISAPGMWMQRITTVEPDDSMIECAILAIEKVIPEDGSDRIP